jgi:methionyl-tRNA synthetase
MVGEVVESDSVSKIAFSDWAKVDLRVGLIESVEDVPGKDKLFKLVVDFSSEKRTILAGLKPFYSADELKGKKSVFVFNLAPRMLAGTESNGMILASKNNEGKYKILFADESLPNGAKLE